MNAIITIGFLIFLAWCVIRATKCWYQSKFEGGCVHHRAELSSNYNVVDPSEFTETRSKVRRP